MTNEEKHVDFETAKLLKEKGFDLEMKPHFNHHGRPGTGMLPRNWNDPKIYDDDFHSRPTLFEAKMWLYEKHGIWVDIRPVNYFKYWDAYLIEGDGFTLGIPTIPNTTPTAALSFVIKEALKTIKIKDDE